MKTIVAAAMLASVSTPAKIQRTEADRDYQREVSAACYAVRKAAIENGFTIDKVEMRTADGRKRDAWCIGQYGVK